MDNKEVGRYWNDNAENWTKLARMGYDRNRNIINSPAFFKMLPIVLNLKGLDIGCGEGYNTRLTAKLGAKINAIDISKVFIQYAIESEEMDPLGIKYQVASGTDLPFSASSIQAYRQFRMQSGDSSPAPQVIRGGTDMSVHEAGETFR